MFEVPSAPAAEAIDACQADAEHENSDGGGGASVLRASVAVSAAAHTASPAFSFAPLSPSSVDTAQHAASDGASDSDDESVCVRVRVLVFVAG